MANIDQTHATALISASLAGTAPTFTGPAKLRLCTGTVPTATVNGTELAASGGYSAGGLSLTAVLGTVASGSVTNTSALNFTNMPAATITAVEVWDSAGTPKRLWYGSITSKTTNSGDTLSFATSSITIALS